MPTRVSEGSRTQQKISRAPWPHPDDSIFQLVSATNTQYLMALEVARVISANTRTLDSINGIDIFSSTLDEKVSSAHCSATIANHPSQQYFDTPLSSNISDWYGVKMMATLRFRGLESRADDFEFLRGVWSGISSNL